MSKDINNTLIEFLTNPKNKNKVLVIKGKWGVGKTFFWTDFIEKNKNAIANAIPNYSYVSLFGVQNFLELKEKVTRNLISLTGDYNQFFEESTKTNIGGFLTAVSKIGWIKRQVGDLSNFLQDALIRNQLICFDDIERIDSKFPIETLMGYADELAQQKNCKIILIFNEDELENKQKETFNKYREKVVDIELTYAPILNEQLEIAFGNKLTKYPIINKVINEQEYVNIIIKNIRVLTKVDQLIADFIKISPADLNPLITEDFIKRAIYLSHCFYEMNSKVPFDIIKNPNSVTEYQALNTAIKGLKEDQEKTAKEHKKNKFKGEYDQSTYDDLMLKIQQLYINQHSVFTEEIIHKLEHGFWSEENLKSFISSEIERIGVITKQSEIRNRLDCAWRLYQSSFQNNLNDIINIFEKELKDSSNYPYWDYGHFIHTLGSYYNFKKLQAPEIDIDLTLIDEYINVNTESLKNLSWHDRIYMNSNTEHVDTTIRDYARQKLNDIKSIKSKTPLSEFIKTLIINGLSDEQTIYIQNLTLPEIEDWLKDLNDPLMTVYIHNLRICSDVAQNGPGRNNPDDPNILINQALDNIASQSVLNQYRIKNLIRSKS